MTVTKISPEPRKEKLHACNEILECTLFDAFGDLEFHEYVIELIGRAWSRESTGGPITESYSGILVSH